jgi:two-component system cell cycle sensor histidine kinase/response regulator CckA
VLVVEDDTAVRQVAVRILRGHGYSVLEARRPTEARAVCDRHGKAIQLLLTDVIMPECTGPQLAQELTARYPEMRVIYMSGYPGGAAARAGALDGSAIYIEKPFSPKTLLERVGAALAIDAGPAPGARST